MAITYSRMLTTSVNGYIDLTNGVNSNNVEIDTTTISGQYEALRRCSVLQEVILLRANAFGNLRIWAKDKYGKKVMNDTVYKDLKKLNYFNPKQDYRSFSNQVEIYASTFGVCFIYEQKVIGFPDNSEFYIIPNWLISPYDKSGHTPYFEQDIDYYQVDVFNGVVRLDKEEVHLIKDNSFNFNGYGYGSRLTGLKEPISLLLSIGEMSTQLIADGGARGIIGQGARDIDMMISPFLNDEKKHIQDELKKYGGLRNQYKYIVTKGTASYVPLTSRIVDMDLSNLDKRSVFKIFGSFGVPKIYAADEPRFKAAPEGRKEFYTGTIVPESIPRSQQLMKLKRIPERRDWEYYVDYSHLDFYQEMLQQSASAQLNASTALKNAIEGGFITADAAAGEFEYYLNR